MQDGTDPWMPETSRDRAMSWLTFIVFLTLLSPGLGLLIGQGYRWFTWAAGL